MFYSTSHYHQEIRFETVDHPVSSIVHYLCLGSMAMARHPTSTRSIRTSSNFGHHGHDVMVSSIATTCHTLGPFLCIHTHIRLKSVVTATSMCCDRSSPARVAANGEARLLAGHDEAGENGESGLTWYVLSRGLGQQIVVLLPMLPNIQSSS